MITGKAVSTKGWQVCIVSFIHCFIASMLPVQQIYEHSIASLNFNKRNTKSRHTQNTHSLMHTHTHISYGAKKNFPNLWIFAIFPIVYFFFLCQLINFKVMPKWGYDVLFTFLNIFLNNNSFLVQFFAFLVRRCHTCWLHHMCFCDEHVFLFNCRNFLSEFFSPQNIFVILLVMTVKFEVISADGIFFASFCYFCGKTYIFYNISLFLLNGK